MNKTWETAIWSGEERKQERKREREKEREREREIDSVHKMAISKRIMTTKDRD